MKVLFAVDGSDGSLEAVAQVAPLLQPGRDELAFFCALPAIRRLGEVANSQTIERAGRDFAGAVFEQARSRLPADWQSTAVEAISGSQDARHGIVDTAERFAAQLIVVGARGLSTLERLLLGSVSRSVVHNAKVPVWVARSRPRSHPEFRVLLACENPEVGCTPARILSGLSFPPDSICRTLTVVPSLFAGKVPDWLQQQARSPDVEEIVKAWAREHDEELHATRAQMQTFSANLPDCQRLEPIVAEGEPAAEILAAITREQIDLVVVGHYRKNWFTSTLLGRTSEAVLNHAECSVLVVPHQGE